MYRSAVSREHYITKRLNECAADLFTAAQTSSDLFGKIMKSREKRAVSENKTHAIFIFVNPNTTANT